MRQVSLRKVIESIKGGQVTEIYDRNFCSDGVWNLATPIWSGLVIAVRGLRDALRGWG
jgi:hypothetical protein